MKRNCTQCIYFKSFREDAFGDKMEPEEYGFCENEKSPLYYNEGAGIDVKCELFNPSKQIER